MKLRYPLIVNTKKNIATSFCQRGVPIILAYWRQRNKSNTYSKKLNFLFKEAVNTIKDFPQIGKQTDDKNARIKIVRDYLIIYEETESTIYILTVWDSRQDPVELEKGLK